MGTKLITERQNPIPFGPGTACGAGVLKGVVICGLSSANGRTYPAEVLRKAVAKYEGAQVYLDHTGVRDARGVREWFGELRNVRSRPDGRPEGDLHFDPAHQFAKEFEGRAKNFPRSLGLSHVAHCQTRRGTDGREVVESIESVESVDLVASPATNSGILEGKGRAVKTFSLKKFVERFGPTWGPAKWGPAKKLCEDLGAIADAPVMDEPPADAAGDDGDLKTALMAALWPIVEEAFDSGSSAKAESALRDFIKMHAKHTGTGKADEVPEEPEETPEGKKRQAGAILEALDVCESVGFTAKRADLEIVAAVPAASRKSVAERLKKTAVTESATGGPQSHTRGRLELPDASGKKVAEGVTATGWQD